ncbi:MAG: hypothetical protein ACOYN0_10230, partial [Phycisphaerales bacterium]
AAITLSNGLVSRTIRVTPNAATVALDNQMTGQSELRSVRPEASVTLNGRAFDVGGLSGQPVHNFILPEWLGSLKAVPGAFTFNSHVVAPIKPRFEWNPRTEWLSAPAAWPPPGLELTLNFAAPPEVASGVAVAVHYEIYDGIPLMCKWITVTNSGDAPVTINSFKSEILATIEPASLVEGPAEGFLPFPRSIHVETDYSFGGSMESGVTGPGFEWKADPLYETQVHYLRKTPCLLESSPRNGPGAVLAPGATFESHRTFELLHDSTDRERRGLAQRRMYRTIAPWVQENPLIFHAASSKPELVRAAVDQASAAGFELIIMTFGSGFDIENATPEYAAAIKDLADYAHSKGVALGGYSLLASRSIDAANDVVNPATGKPGGFAIFGNSPCLESAWGRSYFDKLHTFIEATGLDVLEHDGNYPGDTCGSTTHPGHSGLADSQWRQWRKISDFYKWCRARGVYLNVPDWYYLSGSNKSAMGYRETNWSLPREYQEIIERQNIYDGTWSKTPSMGWMFVPLMEYQGGGAAATIEPLDAHRDHYERRLHNLLGAGVQACYRGPRLFDTDATREMLTRRVGWYKQNRAILESDIVHGPRPGAAPVDWILHVNPRLETAGMLVVHNTLGTADARAIHVNLYYTGLTGNAVAIAEDGTRSPISIDARGNSSIPITVPARGTAYVMLRQR